MIQIYLKDKKEIAFLQETASASFWDKHWETENLPALIRSCTTDNFFIPLVKKYLKKGSTVLEGGCGRGLLVNALTYQGYKAIGIDYAKKTVASIRQAVPELDVREGDVRFLPLKDNELDGYISVGVIEHFWEGDETIISEMSRTIRTNGYLFISFPYMSLLRKLKSSLNLYPVSTFEDNQGEKANFYQFALDHNSVIYELKKHGFSLEETIPFDGIKGFKDEVPLMKPYLQKIYDGKTHQRLRPYWDKLFKPFAAHCILLIMKNEKGE